jgi:hypothetical protein
MIKSKIINNKLRNLIAFRGNNNNNLIAFRDNNNNNYNNNLIIKNNYKKI